MADALDSKSGALAGMRVRVPPSALPLFQHGGNNGGKRFRRSGAKPLLRHCLSSDLLAAGGASPRGRFMFALHGKAAHRVGVFPQVFRIRSAVRTCAESSKRQGSASVRMPARRKMSPLRRMGMRECRLMRRTTAKRRTARRTSAAAVSRFIRSAERRRD